jgi:hypothetical protein
MIAGTISMVGKTLMIGRDLKKIIYLQEKH